MKILRRCFYALASVALLTACNDTLDGDTSGSKGYGDGDGEGVYMALDIKMPGATYGGRSSTDDPDDPKDPNGGDSNSDADPDTEVGWDYENTVNSVAIVLAETETNAFITYGVVYSNGITVKESNTYKSVAKLQKSDLVDFYKKNEGKTKNCLVNVFVFCNPTVELLDSLDKAGSGNANKTDWIDAACNVTEGSNVNDVNTGIWSRNGFLMSNWQIAERALPNSLDDWDHHRTAADAFNLSESNHEGNDDVDNSSDNDRGSIKVERSVARFDFKDGSGNNNTYDVLKAFQTDDKTGEKEEVCVIQVELSRMCLVNMSNKFFYLRRVSSNGQEKDFILCGKETPMGGPTPYVVGPYADKFDKPDLADNFDSTPYFNFPFFNKSGKLDNDNSSRWYVSNIKDVLAHDKDNYGDKEYHIWRYVTENVIPAPITDQQNGISTGVVFKGKMKATDALSNAAAETYPDGQYLYNAINNTNANSPIIYSFDGILYAGWENVRKAVIREAVTVTYNQADYKAEVTINRNNPLYMAVYGTSTECGMGEFEYSYKAATGTTENGTYKDLDIDSSCADAAVSNLEKATESDKTKLLNAMREAVTSAGITIYQPSNDDSEGYGYYCYYYYWNRHNDNGRPGVMGPMEFAVVRNNVYKLSVDKISRIGHPRITDNDPEPPKPGTPDEKDDIYLTVSCKVLPWTVRINKIEF